MSLEFSINFRTVDWYELPYSDKLAMFGPNTSVLCVPGTLPYTQYITVYPPQTPHPSLYTMS